jgi:nodulation protein F
MWSEQFEKLVRAYLPFLADGEPLAAGASLRDLGLDSLSMVELLATLEKQFDVRFRDEALSAATFATPATLWAALSPMLPA